MNGKKEDIKEKNKNSIFKKISHFIKENRKPIFLTIVIFCIVFALIFGVYKIFFSNTNDKLYENFRIVNVDTKEKANRNIKKDTTFYIKTDEKVNVESVRNHIYMSPSIDYEIKKINPKKYELIPTEELVDNQVYSIEEVQNGTSTYKWAFETDRKLSITSHTDNLEKKETIKINFSMENVEDINDYVTISPAVSGTWKKYNSYWVFENKDSFKDGEYTVNISSGIKAGKYTLEDSYKFNFYYSSNEERTNDEIDIYHYTMDDINTFSSKDKIQSTIVLNGYDKLDNKEIETIIYKFNNISDFKDVIKKESALELGKLEKVSSKTEKVHNNVVTLSNNLNSGYYVITFNYKGSKAYQFIQISDMQAYQITTERDVLVWTIKNGKPTGNIEVEFNGKKVKSNKEGIAKIENANNGKLDNTFITVDNTSKNPIVILTSNFDKKNYPNGYIYTDRPIYKAKDKIQIWGYVSVSDFIDKIENKFTIKYGNYVKKVKVGDDGTFTTTIDLNNNIDDDSFGIALYYNDTFIAEREVSVYNYTKPTYTYSIQMNKHVYYAGDTMEFDIFVEHMTGLVAKDKKVKVVYNNNKYSANTNESGIAHFKIKTSYNKENYFYDYNSIYVYTGDDEEDYDHCQASEDVVIYNQNIYVESTTSGKNGNYSLTIKANKIDLEKTEKNNYFDTVLGEKYNKEATIEIYKRTEEKVVDGNYYDDIEGEMVEDFHYDSYEELMDTKKVTLKDGKATLKNLKYSASHTENKDISYFAVIKMKDTNNRVLEDTAYFYYNEDSNYSDEDYLKLYSDNAWYKDDTHNYSLAINNADDSFSDYQANEGENISYSIVDKTGKTVLIDGKVLTVFYKENIINTQNSTSNDLSFTFNKNYIPGIYVASAYLKDGKVYSVAATYVDYNKENKKTNIAIKTNKEEYKPKEEVEATIKVVDKDGKALKSDVNISVVDKAVFEVANDNTNILESIYNKRTFGMYQMATGREYYYSSIGGMGSSGKDQARYNFKDTAYFTTVTTNKNGEAKVKFTLPDNITTYRLTLHSANKDGYVGVNTSNIKVTKDFFIESPMPQGVKYSDDLVVNAVSHGTKASGNVEYTFEIDGKELKTTTTISKYATVNFGSLPVGEYDLAITAKCGEYTDKIINKINIVGNTQEVPVKTTTDLKEKTEIKVTKSPITLEIYDKKLETYLKYIEYLGSNYSSRVDKRIGLYEADRLSGKFYDKDDFSYGDLSEYINEDTGFITTKPNGKEKDILLTAIVHNYTKKYFNYYINANFEITFMNEKTKSRNYYSSILGLAADHNINLSVLDDIKSSDKDRDDLETILLASAYGFLGDYKSAKEIYDALNVKIEQNKVMIHNKEITNDDISSMLAILTSMIDKDTSESIIDSLLVKKSTTKYLNFAIIAYLENNTEIINSKKSVTVHYGKTNKKITIQGFNVEKISLNNKDLETLSFSDASDDLKVSYYYATGIDEVDSQNIKKDVKASISKNIKKNQDVTLTVQYKNNSKEYIDLRVAIPNGLTLDQESLSLGDKIYLKSYKNTYATFSISPEVENVNFKIPFTAVNEGKYVFEPVVILENGIYHISSKNSLNITK